MIKFKPLLAIILFALLTAFVSAAVFANSQTPDKELAIVLLNEPLVEQKAGIPETANEFDNEQVETVIKNEVPELRDKDFKQYKNVPAVVVELTDQEVTQVEKSEIVEKTVENKILRASLTGSVPLIDADAAHSSGYDGTGFAVAILDTGVDSSHPFLNVISEACYSNAGGFGGGVSLCPNGQPSQTGSGAGVNCDESVISDCHHGTHVAGIATGNEAAIDGVAPGADAISIQVFTRFNDAGDCSPDPAPCVGAYTSDIIDGLDRVLTLHNDVGFTTPIASVNMSLGGGLYTSQTSCDSNNAATKAAIDSLRSVGIASVISSGNEYSSTGISTPACISTAVAVGATTKADVVASYSNSNSMLDLWAPGSSITSSVVGGGYSSFSGTSMAAPHVAGAWAVLKQKDPDATVDEALQALKDTGTTILDSRNGLSFPRIDLDNALNHANFSDIVVSATDSTTTEAGATATVAFSLRSMPTDNVAIPLSLSDTSEGTLSAVSSITITPSNWNQPSNNQVTITGIDDQDGDGDVNYTLITGDVTSLDATYDALGANNVSDEVLTNEDDEILLGDIVFGDTDGDGTDEAHLVKYTNTGSGRIEIHTWAPGYSTWVGHTATSHASQPASEVEVVFGDTNGDGKDEAHFVKFANTGSGRIEIHTWAPGYSTWVGHTATSHASVSKVDNAVRFGDTNGDGKDEAHFVKYTNTGSGKIEIHTWAPGYSAWVGHVATSHASLPRYQVDVDFGKSLSNTQDLAHFIKYNNTGSGKIEIHTWAPGYSAWVGHAPTKHSEINRFDASVYFGNIDSGDIDEAHLLKLSNTGSGKLEIHTWYPAFLQWRFHYATSHSQF